MNNVCAHAHDCVRPGWVWNRPDYIVHSGKRCGWLEVQTDLCSETDCLVRWSGWSVHPPPTTEWRDIKRQWLILLVVRLIYLFLILVASGKINLSIATENSHVCASAVCAAYTTKCKLFIVLNVQLFNSFSNKFNITWLHLLSAHGARLWKKKRPECG